MGKTMGNTVCIIMPAYNAQKSVKKAIESVIKQTYKNWELVIVNDGSADNTQKICEQMVSKDSRIHLINQENQGSSRARETGVLSNYAQKHSFITFLDADDSFPNDALEVLMAEGIKYNADVVCGRSEKMIRNIPIGNKWTPPCFDLNKPKLFEEENIKKELIAGFFGISDFPVTLWGKLFKFDIIKKCISASTIVKFTADDLIVTLNVMLNANRVVTIPNVVYQYHIGGGTSKYMPYLADDFMTLYKYRKNLIDQYSLQEELKQSMDIELMYYIKTHLMQCEKYKQAENTSIQKETEKLMNDSDVISAAEFTSKKKMPISFYADLLLSKNYKELQKVARDEIKKSHIKDLIRRVLT